MSICNSRSNSIIEAVKFAAALLLSLLLASPLAAQAATVFGTESGWDVGGTAPLCWVSNITANSSIYDQKNDMNYTNVEVLNADLYGEIKPASLLPSCYEGTDLTVELINLEQHKRQLITDKTYTFRLTLQTNVSNINPDILVQSLNGKSTIHVRLQLCDAILQGFCSPMWDSRTWDSDLTPAETDLDAEPDAEFPDGPAKWKYVPGEQTLLGMDKTMNGKLVFMRWCRWTLRQLTPDSPAFKTSIDISFQLPKGIRTGAYFFIGHAVMNFDLPDGVSVQRIDVAEAIPDNVIEVRDAPEIQEVSDAMIWGIAAATALFGMFALSLLVFIIVKRDHPVMHLAQGSFLAAMTAACVLQICFTFTFLPLKDAFCRMSGPLVLVPMTFVGAVCVGRVWRVYRTLSFAQTFATKQDTNSRCSFSDSFINFLSTLAALPLWWHSCCKNINRGATNQGPPRHRRSIKITVTAEESMSLIGMLTLPQLVVQVVASIWFGRGLTTLFDPTENYGCVTCDGEDWAFYFGFAYLAFIYSMAVMVAWISRSLPSAFNESEQIFNAAAICALLAFMTISLFAILKAPTTHADVKVFLLAVFSIGVSFSVLILIVVPKVRRVMSGETVVISSILGNRYSMSTGSTGRPASHLSSATETDYAAGISPELQSVTPKSDAQGSSMTTQFSQHNRPLKSSLKSSTMLRPPAESANRRNTLKDDDPLPEALEQRIIGMQSALSSCTSKLAQGRPLSAEEIRLLQGGVAGLQEELDLVEFESQKMPKNSLAAGSPAVSFHPEESSSRKEEKLPQFVDEGGEELLI